MIFLKQNWIKVVVIGALVLANLVLLQQNSTSNLAAIYGTEEWRQAQSSDSDFDEEEWNRKMTQRREEGKRFCDEYNYPDGALTSWPKEPLEAFVICKSAEKIGDYINVIYVWNDIRNPNSEFDATIEYKKVNDVNLAAIMGVMSTSNYYFFYDDEFLADLIVSNGKRHGPSYEIISDKLGSQWFVSTELGNSGSDMSEYIDTWYWIRKDKPELKKVLEYPSIGGFGTGWGIFNDSGWLQSSFSVEKSFKNINGNSYIDFDFRRLYEFGDEELVSNKISMRYQWVSVARNFAYVSGNSGFKLSEINGDNAPLFIQERNECNYDSWLFCMYADFIKEFYQSLAKIAAGSDINKKQALAEILILEFDKDTDEKVKQDLEWYNNLPEVQDLLNLLGVVKGNPTFNDVVSTWCNIRNLYSIRSLYRDKEIKWNAVVSPNAHTSGIRFWVIDKEHPVGSHEKHGHFWGTFLASADDPRSKEDFSNDEEGLRKWGEEWDSSWVKYIFDVFGNIGDNDRDRNTIFEVTATVDNVMCEEKDSDGLIYNDGGYVETWVKKIRKL